MNKISKKLISVILCIMLCITITLVQINEAKAVIPLAVAIIPALIIATLVVSAGVYSDNRDTINQVVNDCWDNLGENARHDLEMAEIYAKMGYGFVSVTDNVWTDVRDFVNENFLEGENNYNDVENITIDSSVSVEDQYYYNMQELAGYHVVQSYYSGWYRIYVKDANDTTVYTKVNFYPAKAQFGLMIKADGLYLWWVDLEAEGFESIHYVKALSGTYTGTYEMQTSYPYTAAAIVGESSWDWENPYSGGRDISIPTDTTDQVIDNAIDGTIGKDYSDVINDAALQGVEDVVMPDVPAYDIDETDGTVQGWLSALLAGLTGLGNVLTQGLNKVWSAVRSIPSAISSIITDAFVPTLDLTAAYSNIKTEFDLKMFGLPESVPFTQYLVEGEPPIIYITNPINQNTEVLVDFADYVDLFSKIRLWCGGIMIVLTGIWFIRTFRPQQTID